VKKHKYPLEKPPLDLENMPQWAEDGEPIGVHTLYFHRAIEIDRGHGEFLIKLMDQDPEVKRKFDEWMQENHRQAWFAFRHDKGFQAWLESASG